MSIKVNCQLQADNLQPDIKFFQVIVGNPSAGRFGF